MFRMLQTLKRAYVAAKCLASSAVGFAARALWLGGNLKGGSVTSSCVFRFLALRITIEENKPSGVLLYKDMSVIKSYRPNRRVTDF